MGDAVALVSPRIEGGLIRPLGFGEGFSALLSQAPKYLRTWDGLTKPIPVRIKGNLDITTPVRTKQMEEPEAVAKDTKKKRKVAKREAKSNSNGKIMIWNKGNATFQARKGEVEMILDKHKPLVLGLCEANMGVNTFASALGIDGYHLERDNLTSEGIRTRTALYIKETLNYKRREDLEAKASPTIWIEVNTNTTSAWLLFVGYREWVSLKDKDREESRSVPKQLERLQGWKKGWLMAEAEGKPIYAMGDMNVDVEPWIHPQNPLTNYQEGKKQLLEALIDMATATSMELIATQPTRMQGSNKASTIDIMLTNAPETIEQHKLHTSSSDHLIVEFTKNDQPKCKEPLSRLARSFKEYTKEKMNEQINSEMLESLLWSSDTNLVANVLTCHITEALNIVAPLKRIQKRHKYAPYLKDSTKEMMKERDRMKEQAYKNGKEEDMKEFKKRKNATLREQRRDKASWALKLIEPELNDGRKLWKTVQNISRAKQSRTLDKLEVKGVNISNKEEMAEVLNHHFVDKVALLVKGLPEAPSDIMKELKERETVNSPQMELKEIRMQELEKLVKEIRRTPAAGIDGISGIVIKDIFQKIKHVLLHLMNLSQCSGIYPNIFKQTKIIPIVKAGKNPLLPESFRPVSNISTLGKLIERGVMNQVETHLRANNLTHCDQHGGRKGHSTTTCLTEILEEVKESQEKKEMVALMAIDLSAAYDMVNHNLLLEKCRILNFDQKTLNWTRDFLSSRSQIIEIQGSRSQPLMTGNQGVVQGGPSSGLLFNIYIDDLPDQVKDQDQASNTPGSAEKQFVDDGTVIARGKCIQHLRKSLKANYKSNRDYLVNLRMVINCKKTQLLFIKPHPDPDELWINIEGIRIKHQSSIKILGMTISEDLKFEEHVWKGKGSIAKSISYKASLMRTLKPYLPQNLRYKVGNALINSAILYCAPIWGPSSKNNRDKIQAAQVRAARIVSGKWNKPNKIYHRQELLSHVEWPNVDQLLLMSTLGLLNSAIHGKSSQGISRMFNISKPPTSSRRQILRIDFKGNKSRTATTFSVNATEQFNMLPNELKNPATTQNQFKRNIKQHAMSSLHLSQH